MQLQKYQEDILLCRALQELNKELEALHVKPFSLNVCGGFALLLQEIRKNTEQYTDIDYIGKDLPKDVQEVVQKIGVKYHFGSDWINNDILLTGSSLEDLEFTTGKLHFQKKMDLSVITIYALEKKDLLRMKAIAIDTSLTAIEFGGEFTRMKDFNDIKLLADDLHWNMDDIKKECGWYICSPYTYDLIEMYMNEKDQDNALEKVSDCIYKIQDDPAAFGISDEDYLFCKETSFDESFF